MALNSSGPISLAGSTTGQSIAVELGNSATGQTSLNDSDVRTLAGVASGTITIPTDFWGKANATSGAFLSFYSSADFISSGARSSGDYITLFHQPVSSAFISGGDGSYIFNNASPALSGGRYPGHSPIYVDATGGSYVTAVGQAASTSGSGYIYYARYDNNATEYNATDQINTQVTMLSNSGWLYTSRRNNGAYSAGEIYYGSTYTGDKFVFTALNTNGFLDTFNVQTINGSGGGSPLAQYVNSFSVSPNGTYINYVFFTSTSGYSGTYYVCGGNTLVGGSYSAASPIKLGTTPFLNWHNAENGVCSSNSYCYIARYSGGYGNLVKMSQGTSGTEQWTRTFALPGNAFQSYVSQGVGGSVEVFVNSDESIITTVFPRRFGSSTYLQNGFSVWAFSSSGTLLYSYDIVGTYTSDYGIYKKVNNGQSAMQSSTEHPTWHFINCIMTTQSGGSQPAVFAIPRDNALADVSYLSTYRAFSVTNYSRSASSAGGFGGSGLTFTQSISAAFGSNRQTTTSTRNSKSNPNQVQAVSLTGQ